MATIVTDLHCDLTQNVKPQFLHGNLFSQDNAANTINVHVFNDGEPATLGGSISANVIRSDGATVAVSGEIDGNKAYIILPQACYAVPGVIKIIVKNTENTTVTTIAAVVANVYASSTDTVVDPGTIIPSVAALIAQIEAAVDSIPVDYSGLLATIAGTYSSSKTYKVGDYAWEAGVLKRCIVPITTAETYTAAHWTNAVIGDDLSALKSAITAISNSVNMFGGVTTGFYINASGEVTSFEYAAYSDYIPVVAGKTYGLQWTQITMRGQWNFRVHGYNSSKVWDSQVYTKFEPREAGTYTDSFTVPSGISYVRLSLYYYADMSDIFVYDNTDGVGLTAFDKLARKQSKIVPQLTNILGFKWNEGKYVYADGSVTTANDRACTDFIPCSPFVSVKYVGENNHANVCGLAFYDSAFKFISGDKNSGTLGNETTVTSPANTAYLRLSTKLSILDDSYVHFGGDNNSALMAISKIANNISVYVDGTNGNDSTGLGTALSPYKTIQHALDLGYTKIGILTGETCVETVSADGKTVHLYAAKNLWNSSYPNRIRAKIDGNNTAETALTIKNAKNVVLEDIEVCNCTGDGCLIDGCGNVLLINCSFHDNGNNGIVLNYTNGVLRKCIAYNNTRDGFNMNYYGDTQFYDCSGWDNGDDGISHHQGCTGMIVGGEWYGNTKGGVASPANGALVDIYNVYSHDNGYGIWANADLGTEARTFRVFNCVLVNNSNYGITSSRNTALCYGCKISGNTTGQTSGNVTILD